MQSDKAGGCKKLDENHKPTAAHLLKTFAMQCQEALQAHPLSAFFHVLLTLVREDLP